MIVPLALFWNILEDETSIVLQILTTHGLHMSTLLKTITTTLWQNNGISINKEKRPMLRFAETSIHSSPISADGVKICFYMKEEFQLSRTNKITANVDPSALVSSSNHDTVGFTDTFTFFFANDQIYLPPTTTEYPFLMFRFLNSWILPF